MNDEKLIQTRQAMYGNGLNTRNMEGYSKIAMQCLDKGWTAKPLFNATMMNSVDESMEMIDCSWIVQRGLED